MAELDEDAGPLEATIVHLKREIGMKQADNAELQRLWIKAQTELVNVQNSNQTVSEQLHDKRAKSSILMQKQLRLNVKYEKEGKEGKELERGSSNLHNEMTKVNQLLASHNAKQKSLADDNFLMETEFVEKLKALEQEAVSAESQIVDLKAQKERLMLDTVEAEKQELLLDKKIALERETQAALDPEVGAAEVRAMQREIHRMRLRYAALQRRQEQMIAEMERAVYKRDNIEAKGKLAAAKKGSAPTQAALNKEITELTKKLKGTTHDANVSQLAVQRQQEASAEETARLEALEQKALELRQHSQRLEESIGAQEQQELLLQHQLRAQSRLTRKLTAAAEGGYQPIGREDEIQERLTEAQDTSQRLVTVIESLGAEFPHVAPRLSSLVQTVSVA
uniref:Cilia- and flagella-associated protein 157 n=1 Tax=Haptolina ericina TaxID=156174 RepID=A0A7S3BNX6_9EUKA|mmetsp:Transcript_64305/g.143677  ORF Transcript_64305/g.143677 Transcript_64305/m.143677 type:complete len:394 (+) Transcript_64305:3-1184(+)